MLIMRDAVFTLSPKMSYRGRDLLSRTQIKLSHRFEREDKRKKQRTRERCCIRVSARQFWRQPAGARQEAQKIYKIAPTKVKRERERKVKRERERKVKRERERKVSRANKVNRANNLLAIPAHSGPV